MSTFSDKPCVVCDGFAPNRMQAVNDAVRRGDRSLVDLASEFSLDLEALRMHAKKCIPTILTEEEILAANQQALVTIAMQFQTDIAEGKHYKVDEANGIDGRGAVNHYVALTRELRETVVARHRLRGAEEVTKGLTENIVNPLIVALTSIITEEAHRLRETVFTLTNESSSQHPAIAQVVETMLERIAYKFKTEALVGIPDKVKVLVK